MEHVADGGMSPARVSRADASIWLVPVEIERTALEAESPRSLKVARNWVQVVPEKVLRIDSGMRRAAASGAYAWEVMVVQGATGRALSPIALLVRRLASVMISAVGERYPESPALYHVCAARRASVVDLLKVSDQAEASVAEAPVGVPRPRCRGR
ncbi:hypothetical protein FMEAI12_4980012 [Parafrankia sp. Ea1.12]|nr:hypothetical protein FMEAI12_4980012 [Parafrankia sp. Ea1.12]